MKYYCKFCDELCDIFFENNTQIIFTCPNCNMKHIVYKNRYIRRNQNEI